MGSIKATLHFQINYGVKQQLHPKYRMGNTSKHQTYNPNTKRCSLCLNKKLEIARYNLLNKRSEIINKCCHQNKFAIALYDIKDWIKVSVTAFKKPCVRDHSFPKYDCSKSSWSQTGFGNQCFPVLVGLFSKHAYEITVSSSLVG